MRSLAILATVGAALAVSACTYVERERTPPTVVQSPPTVVAPAPAPTVTVRPAY